MENTEEYERDPSGTETSKRLYYLFILVAIILLLSIVIVSASGGYCTDLVTVTVAWIGFLAAYSAFYLWKSKNENRAKYAQKFIRKFANKYGVDAAIHISEVVLKD